MQKEIFEKHEEYKQSLTTDNIFENHSEAGPDVAEFSEEELRSVAERKYCVNLLNGKLDRDQKLGGAPC